MSTLQKIFHIKRPDIEYYHFEILLVLSVLKTKHSFCFCESVNIWCIVHIFTILRASMMYYGYICVQVENNISSDIIKHFSPIV